MRTLAVALGIALTLGLGSAGCESRRSSQSATVGGERSAADEPSIYGLDLPLTDQNGATSRLADLRGRVLVAAMMYGSCKTVCPRVTEDMKGIESQLAGADRDSVGFVLFSLDPGRDTPAALRGFARLDHLDLSRWRLFATSEDGVREMAAVLGVKYQVEESGEIAHSAMIFVIDREGVVRHRQVGLNQEPRELMDAVASALR